MGDGSGKGFRGCPPDGVHLINPLIDDGPGVNIRGRGQLDVDAINTGRGPRGVIGDQAVVIDGVLELARDLKGTPEGIRNGTDGDGRVLDGDLDRQKPVRSADVHARQGCRVGAARGSGSGEDLEHLAGGKRGRGFGWSVCGGIGGGIGGGRGGRGVDQQAEVDIGISARAVPSRPRICGNNVGGKCPVKADRPKRLGHVRGIYVIKIGAVGPG